MWCDKLKSVFCQSSNLTTREFELYCHVKAISCVAGCIGKFSSLDRCYGSIPLPRFPDILTVVFVRYRTLCLATPFASLRSCCSFSGWGFYSDQMLIVRQLEVYEYEQYR